MTTRIGIHGAGGRMGRRLMALACADQDLDLVGAIERPGHPLIGKAISDIEPTVKTSTAVAASIKGNPDVVVDFSMPDALEPLLEEAVATGVALVVGTTGLTDEHRLRLAKAAKIVPVVHAANMSLGINLLLRVCREVAGALGEDFDIEVSETHHNRKVDAPSGTALALAETIAETLERDLDANVAHGRSGRPGARPAKEIGMHALRLGGVVGEHTVHFGSEYEIVELTHKALNRDVFVAGALRAAKWVAGRKAGLYNMEDVLFGKA